MRLWLEELGSSAPARETLECSLVAAHIDCSGDLEQGDPGVLLFDDVDAACEWLRGRPAGGRVIAVAASELRDDAAFRLLSAGACDALEWGASSAEAISQRAQRWAEVDSLLEDPLVEEVAVGGSASWRGLLAQIVEVAAFTDSSVLLLGESGTGKEILASLIHALDKRSEKRELVIVDCTTLAPELAGSELFGHERGAFTGATSQREGAIALAHGGTLFLDEVGELPPTIQAQLLRAVQERLYKPVGSNVWHRARFRLVCATHRDLVGDVRTGAFRADLYHRISTWVFRTPPLRERIQDVLPLAAYFARQVKGRPVEFHPAVQSWLLRREYPGNVRELKQLCTRLVQRHVGPGPVTVGAIPTDDRPHDIGSSDWRDSGLERAIQHALALGVGLKEIGRGATDLAVRLVIEQEQGNLQRAARKLGVTDRALQLRRGGKKRDTAELV